MFVCFSRHGANGEAMNSFKQMIKAGVAAVKRVTDKKSDRHRCAQCEAMRSLMQQRGSWFGSTFEINTSTEAERELVESYGGSERG